MNHVPVGAPSSAPAYARTFSNCIIPATFGVDWFASDRPARTMPKLQGRSVLIRSACLAVHRRRRVVLAVVEAPPAIAAPSTEMPIPSLLARVLQSVNVMVAPLSDSRRSDAKLAVTCRSRDRVDEAKPASGSVSPPTPR